MTLNGSRDFPRFRKHWSGGVQTPQWNCPLGFVDNAMKKDTHTHHREYISSSVLLPYSSYHHKQGQVPSILRPGICSVFRQCEPISRKQAHASSFNTLPQVEERFEADIEKRNMSSSMILYPRLWRVLCRMDTQVWPTMSSEVIEMVYLIVNAPVISN